MEMWAMRLPISITTPGKPASETSKSLPQPTIHQGASAFSAALIAAVMSAALLARTKNWAGPPQRNVVCLLMGSFFSRSSLAKI